MLRSVPSHTHGNLHIGVVVNSNMIDVFLLPARNPNTHTQQRFHTPHVRPVGLGYKLGEARVQLGVCPSGDLAPYILPIAEPCALDL